MTEEEYKAAVIKVGQAFKELPDDHARLEVLAGLVTVMITKSVRTEQAGSIKDWLEDARGNLKGVFMLWKRKDH